MSKILIIEDEPTIVDLISFNLKREGFEVEAAYDGVTGLEKALRGDADLVLLDVMLPGMNGFDVLQKLRQAADGLHGKPVIMVPAALIFVDLGMELVAQMLLRMVHPH